MVCRSFKYVLEPTVRQRRLLSEVLAKQCELYNAALEERRGRWRWNRESVSYFDQCRTLTGLREVRPDVLVCGVTVCRGTLKRLDRAFAGFYRRCRTGQTPGFPRFKSAPRWDSVRWEDTNGWRLQEHRKHLHVHGLGDTRVRLHRPVRGTPKAITVRREGRRWYVTVRCVDVPVRRLASTGREVGLDVGIASLVATSDGEQVTNPRWASTAADRLAAAQRSLAAKQRGSNRRRRAVERVAGCHRAVRNQRLDHLHKLSRRLVDDYDLIVYEDLGVAGMTRRPTPRLDPDGTFAPNGAAAKTGLNRSIHDAGWATLVAMLAYNAEDAGREIVAVRAAYTSQTCAECGHVDAANRPTQATFKCVRCGHTDHADLNAARNILRLGRSQRSSPAAQSRT
jgi:putative transposase